MWGMQVKLGDDWHWVSSTNKVLYQFDTKDMAENALRKYYPDQVIQQRLCGLTTKVRVKEYT
jgi:hypothetical protein